MTEAASNSGPFTDLSQQKSEFIRSVTEELKGPLLVIYEIGVKRKCSHYKHAVRLCEYVLLAPKGEKLNFPFDEEKIKKTKENFKTCGLTHEDKLKVTDAWKAAFEGIEVLMLFQKRTDIHERFVYLFVTRLLKSFAAGTNIEHFHRVKVHLFDMYNELVETAAGADFDGSRVELQKKVRQLGIPVVG